MTETEMNLGAGLLIAKLDNNAGEYFKGSVQVPI